MNQNDIINEILSEIAPSEAPSEAPAEEVEATEQVQPDASAQEATQELEENEVTETRPALSPLLAEKAAAERELRAQLAEQESSRSTDIDAAKAELLQELINDPQGFIGKYDNLDLDNLATHFYAASLGEEAPDDLKAHVGASDIERKLATLQAKVDQNEQNRITDLQAAKAKLVIQQYQDFTASVPSNMPYFAAEAAHSPTEAIEAMADLADHAYKTTGRYPSASDVAAQLEANIKETLARYSSVLTVNNPKSAPVTKVAKTPKTSTLTNENDLRSSTPEPEGEDELFESALAFAKENGFF